MNRVWVLVLMLCALALTPAARADGLDLPVQPIGTVNAVVAFTPFEDSSQPGGDGFGRIFLGYALNGTPNAFVYWIPDSLVEPFTVSNGQITFVPGNYNYAPSGESLNISSASSCCSVVFTFYGEIDTYSFVLPSTITPLLNPTWHTYGGDEYEVFNVPVEVSTPLPEPGTLLLLGIGLASVVFLQSVRRR